MNMLREALIKSGGMTDAQIAVAQNISIDWARKIMLALEAADKNIILNRRTWTIKYVQPKTEGEVQAQPV
jgi:predicted transcriptional regulator